MCPICFVMAMVVLPYQFFRKMAKILMAEVMANVNKPNAVFSLGYYKDDGSYSEKKNIINRSKNLNDRKKMSRSGLFKLFDRDKGRAFDVTIDLVMMFNGSEIIREE